MYKKMSELGFTGLEIAPTRIFPKRPYDCIKEAIRWSEELRGCYGFEIPSMQSIWYGRTESIFGTLEERKKLLAYTHKAIDFAVAVGCRNLVFGCPKNRSLPEGGDSKIAFSFFQRVAEYAESKNIIIGFEANPVIYHTNYINNTLQALDLIKAVSSDAFLLNLDIGTILYNQEDLSELDGNVRYISHVHVSEPDLVALKKRELHKAIGDRLKKENYVDFISIEMTRQTKLDIIVEAMNYVKEIFD